MGTLENGCGVCLEKLDVLVALARAGGIPARYAVVGSLSVLSHGGRASHAQPPNILDHLTAGPENNTDRLVGKFETGLRRFLSDRVKAERGRTFTWSLHPHAPHAELRIGGFWIPADPTWGDADAAAFNIPLPRLGYDPLMLQGLTGSVIERIERTPEGHRDTLVRYLWSCLGRGILDYVNRKLEEGRARGRQILGAVGRGEYTHRMRHFYVPVPGSPEPRPPGARR